MERDIFSNDDIKKFINTNLVSLKVNTETSEFAHHLSITNVPTIVIVTTSNSGVGDVVGINVGYTGPTGFDSLVVGSERKSDEIRLDKIKRRVIDSNY
jgi:hypothetical protein